jgi:hypothetical protein
VPHANHGQSLAHQPGHSGVVHSAGIHSVFPIHAGITTAQNGLAKLDSEFKGLFSEFCTLNEFAGKEGTSASARYGQKQRHVALIGVGPAAKAKAVAEWGMSPFQAAGSVAATLAKTLRSKSAAVALLDLESLSDSEKVFYTSCTVLSSCALRAL